MAVATKKSRSKKVKAVEEVKVQEVPVQAPPSLPVHVNGDGQEGEDLEIHKLDRQLVRTARDFNRSQFLKLLGTYESIQKIRMGASNRLSAHYRQVDVADPDLLLRLKADLKIVENNAARGMREHVMANPLGRWCCSIAGVDFKTTGSLLAHIDFHHCCCPQYKGLRQENIPPHECPGLLYAGYIFSFAGQLDPRKQRWEKGQKRPYNLRLKKTCWMIGEGFKKMVVGKDALLTDDELARKILEKKPSLTDAEVLQKMEKLRNLWTVKAENLPGEEFLYVRLYMERKKQEVELNEQGAFADQAREKLEEARFKGWNISKEQRAIWESGRLQPVGLDLRAKRYAVRLYLSHYHTLGAILNGLKPVKPWVIQHGGHERYIPPPMQHVIQKELDEAKERFGSREV